MASRVTFVPDDATVVRYSELASWWRELGNLRDVADRYGVAPSTVMRHLHAAGIDTARVPTSEVARLRARVAELEAAVSATHGSSSPTLHRQEGQE